MPRMRTRGFTLVELMVTIAIVAILAAIAFPNFEASIRSNRIATSTNELIGALTLARSEAMRSPGGAVVCASSDGANCTGSWNQGWIVWMDLNGNRNLDGNDRVIRASQARNRITVTEKNAVNRIEFDHRGRVSLSPTPSEPLALTVAPTTCPTNAKLRRTITLTVAGQITSTQVDC